MIIGSLTDMAQTGGLDGTLLSEGGFYNTNYTKPLLFLADGTYLANIAGAQHLQGTQWGMMNETGNYPGQAWLWLYTMWYQVYPMNQSSNADLEVWSIMMVLSVGLIFLPFIPGLRSIPRWTRVYKLIWRRHYRAPWPLAPDPGRSCASSSVRQVTPDARPRHSAPAVRSGVQRVKCRPERVGATRDERASTPCRSAFAMSWPSAH